MSNTNFTKEDDWVATSNRYVAFIDIMGFKDMVATIPHNDIYEMMKKVNQRKRHIESIPWSAANSELLVRTTTYSDSMMVYSKDDSIKSLNAIVNSVATLTHYLFIEGIPHKGSIAFGQMTLDIPNSIFFGQPLIDAYLLQEQLYFYGVIIHATAEFQIVEVHKDSPPFLSTYLCPLKNGSANHLTLYPMYSTDKSPQNAAFFEAFHKFKFKTSGYLRKYIDNTEAYFDSLVKK